MNMRSSLLCGLLLMVTAAQGQHTLSLRQAIDFGKANSPALVIAANDQQKAKAQALEAVSGYLPQINGTGQLDDNLLRPTTILPGGIFGPDPVALQFGTEYITTLNIQAEQTLIDVAQLNGIQANKPNTAMAGIKQKQVEEQLVYDVARAYAQAQTYAEQMRLLDDNMLQYDQLVPILRLRLEKGVIEAIELDRLEVTQRNIRSQRKVAEANYDISVDQLKRIIGMPMNTAVELTDDLAKNGGIFNPAEADYSPENLLSYKMTQQNILLHGIDLKSKRSAFLPTLSAYGQYGTMAQGNDLGDSFNNWFDYSAIGFKLKVPIFSGLRRTSQMQQSEIALNNLRERQRQSLLDWELDFRSADTRLITSTSNVDNDRENLLLAERVLSTTNLQYQQGLASMSDLLNADYQLKEARNNYTTSLLNRAIAVIDVEKARGTLLELVNTL
jgi:outer membrane protein TolC